MHRPSAQEFLQALLETLDDLPAGFRPAFRGDPEERRGRPIAGDPSALRGVRR